MIFRGEGIFSVRVKGALSPRHFFLGEKSQRKQQKEARHSRGKTEFVGRWGRNARFRALIGFDCGRVSRRTSLSVHHPRPL